MVVIIRPQRHFVQKKRIEDMFDSHAHLGKLTSDAIIATSRPDEWEEVNSFPYHAIGLLEPEPELWEAFRSAVLSSPSCMIGEVGLDRRFPDPYQKEFFRKCLSLSAETGKSLIIHQVGMTGILLESIRDALPLPPFMVHGFTGSGETARELIRLGGTISLSPRAERTRHFPSLLECPFLLETDMKSGSEQTETLKLWYKRVAGLKGVPLPLLEETTDERRAVFTS